MEKYPEWPSAKSKPRKNGLYWFFTGKQCEFRGRVGYHIPSGDLVVDIFKTDKKNYSQRFFYPVSILEYAPEIQVEFQKLLNHFTPWVLE